MNKKHWIRVAVLAGLLAWPAVETCRYFQTVERLEAALQLQDRVSLKLLQAKIAHRARLPKADAALPVANPSTGQTAASSL